MVFSGSRHFRADSGTGGGGSRAFRLGPERANRPWSKTADPVPSCHLQSSSILPTSQFRGSLHLLYATLHGDSQRFTAIPVLGDSQRSTAIPVLGDSQRSTAIPVLGDSQRSTATPVLGDSQRSTATPVHRDSQRSAIHSNPRSQRFTSTARTIASRAGRSYRRCGRMIASDTARPIAWPPGRTRARTIGA